MNENPNKIVIQLFFNILSFHFSLFDSNKNPNENQKKYCNGALINASVILELIKCAKYSIT